jgi:hypothetical protein
MSKHEKWYFVTMAILSLIFTGGIVVSFSSPDPTRTFTPSELRTFVTEQAECHAEFFYTNDPSITGVGIDEAVTACLPR